MQNAWSWLFRVEHRQKASKLRLDVEKAFTEHPELTGETYLQHLWFTLKMSLRFVMVSFIMIAHGLFPFLFTRAASSEIEQVYRTMKARVPKPARLPSRKLFTPRQRNTSIQRIGIVGGGFSGTMLVAQLVKAGESPLSIEWFDDSASPGTGIAYGTAQDCHLLNVPAGKMGAFAGEPDGFFQWLQGAEGRASAANICPEREITQDAFLPRTLYAQYLHSIRSNALLDAKGKGIEVAVRRSQVVDARLAEADASRLLLSVQVGGALNETQVDVMALATGNMPPRPLSFQPGMIRGVRHYVADVWKPGSESVFPEQVNQLSADSEIVIIGTGLTMVDAVLTLRKHGFKGMITTISRHGLLPAPHAPAKPYSAWEWVAEPESAPRTALGLFKRLRWEIRKAQGLGYDWRSVVDSLRPVTQQLWRQLRTREKRKFMGRLLTLWNVHRHRMAPQIHTELKTMQQSGSLKVVPGRIYYVGSDEDGLTVAYRKRGANRVETIRAALVLNCTGPEYDIAAGTHRLLGNLRDHGLVTVGPLRMGVELAASGSAKGNALDTIFPIGTLLIGELLECTAVPELREQAGQVAQAMTRQLKQLRENEAGGHLLGTWI